MDKNQAMLNFLLTCPFIQKNPIFFNFGNIESDAFQMITHGDDVATQRPFIDGSVAKRYTFSVDCFKSVTYNPIVQVVTDENLTEFKEAQDVLDWINKNGDDRIFPDFGPDCVIDAMKVNSAKPELVSVDTTQTPATAIYRISCYVDYVDYSKRVWK